MTSIQYASEIEEIPQESLWPGFIPQKALTVLMGTSGIGKSSLMREIVRRLTRGEDLPDGWHNEDDQGVGVIWISNEEDTASVLIPELRKCGAALEKIRIMSMLTPDVVKLGEPAEREFRADRPEDLALLRQVIWENVDDNIGLIVIDSARGMSDKSISNPKPCREVLKGLQQVAQDTSVAIVLLHHVNRASSRKTAIERIGGSAEMYNVPRAVLLAATSDADPSKVSLSVPKAFLCAPPPSITYQRTVDGKVEFIKGVRPEKAAEYEELDRKHLDDAIIAFLEASPERGYQARQVSAGVKRNYDATAKQLQRLTDAGRIERVKYGVYCAKVRQNVQVEASLLPTTILAPTNVNHDAPTEVLAPSNGTRPVPMR